MEHNEVKAWVKPRQYRQGFWATVSWLVPAMLVVALGGFFVGRDVFSPQFLEESKVQQVRVKPKRVLSPEEAARIANDQPSHVWTEGVKETDIPKLEEKDKATGEQSQRRHRRHRARPTTTEAAPATGAGSTDSAPTTPAEPAGGADSAPTSTPPSAGEEDVTPD